MLNKLSTLPRVYVWAILLIGSWALVAVPVWLIWSPSYWAASVFCALTAVALYAAGEFVGNEKAQYVAIFFAIAAAVFSLNAVL